MKVSLKLDDDRHRQSHRHLPLLLHTKIPISIFNLPFFSHFSTSTTNPSQLSLALSTNFSTGPSLKLSYATAATTTTDVVAPPLSLTLKSGTGLFGSPKNSALNISAQFSFNPSNPNNPNPTFCLYFKPQLGSFSLRKSTFSHSKPDLSSCGSSTDNSFDSNSFHFVPLERPIIGVKDSSVGENGKNQIFKGIQLAAATQMTVAKRVALSFRWLMEFPEENSAITMPILRIKKLGIQRIPDHVLKVEGDETIARRDESERELEVLKGACSWMKKELTDLTRVNREMQCELEEIKVRNSESFELKSIQKKDNIPSTPGFEQLKRRRGNGVEENVNVHLKKEEKKKKNSDSRPGMDVESELQKAIMAAEAAAAATATSH